MPNLTPDEYEVVLRADFCAFVARCLAQIYPRTELAMNGHIEVMASKLAAVHDGEIRRLIINVPPRHLKSLIGSVAFQPGASAMIPRRKSCVSAMRRISPTSTPAIAGMS